MTSQERERMYIANCLICTLAACMRDCEKCPFKIGLKVKAEQQKTPVFSQAINSKG